MQRLNEYITGVSSGKILVGNEIQLAINRYTADLQREDLIFRSEKVQSVIDFIQLLEHSTGKHEGKPFILSDWQVFIIANIYGFYWKDTGLRRFTSSYLEIGRKNGKSSLAAALALYHLIADGEGSAEVLLAANSKEQAKIAFDITSKFVKRFDPKQKYLLPYRSEVKFKSRDAVLKVLASDDSKLDGFNSSMAIVDEFHAAKTSKVRDVIKSSMGMRSQPHLCTITTAGFDKTSPCYQLRKTAIEVLSGLKKDDTMFIAIFSLDEKDNWQDSKNFIKANPNLGITIREDFIREQIQQAINNPSDETGVRTKNLNQWVDSLETWIPDIYINKSSKTLQFEDFRDVPCYVGVDLAATSDLTAVNYMWFVDGKYYFKINYYLPEHPISTNIDKELYRQWHRQKSLTISPGNVTDYDLILNDLLKVNTICPIFKVSYDSWNSSQFVISATEKGLPCESYSQALGNFNKPTKELERLLLSDCAVIDNNPITRFCFTNVFLKLDINGNSKPSKSNPRKKIDGVISMLMALGKYLETPKYSNTIY